MASMGFSQKANVGVLLYDQISNQAESYPNSMYSYLATDVANKSKTTFSADDFVVPTGETWDIDFIDVLGAIDTYAATPDVDSVNVIIYAESDTAAIPGSTIVYSASNITTLNYYGDGDFLLSLPSTISLTEGTYWLCIQAVRDHAADGYWSWEGQTSGANGTAFHYKNPELGYWYNAPEWTSGQTLVSYWSSFDMSFALYGPRLSDDIALVSLDAPFSSPSMGMEDVTITIENPGLNDQTGFDVRYQIDGGGWVTENVGTLNVAAGTIESYTFTAQADLSGVQAYTFDVEIVLGTDQNTSNNAYSTIIENFGEYYLFTQFDSISTCGGGFADAGGPAGSWTAPMSDTCTIYPVGENTRTRLIFHEFDNGWGEFYIYDGPDANSPVIDLTPDNVNTVYAYDVTIMDTVTAKNTTGALTIVFDGTYGSSVGWDASIECYTPPADDFEMVDMWTSIPTIFEGQELEIQTVIYNAGLTEQSKDVIFYINDAVHGTVTSDVISANEYDTVSIAWTPDAGGVFDLKASVIADDGDAENDTISIVRSVYADGDLVESFEGSAWLPEFWTSTNSGWYRNSSDWDIYQEGEFWATAKQQDTLVSPRLIIEDGDVLELKAFSQMWWYTTLDLYYSENPTGPWTFIANIPVSSFDNSFQDFSIDISAAAGNNYLGFATGVPGFSGLDMNIDFVRGPQIFYFDDNISAKSISADVSPMQYDTLPYQIKIKNNGLNDLAADSYIVKLMMDEGEYGQTELASVSGAALASKTAMTYTLEYAIQDIGYANIYGLVEYTDDQYIEDNTTRILKVYAQAAGTDTVEVGNATAYQYYYPFNGSMNTEVRQTMYYADEVGAPGTINGLTYFYKSESVADYTDIPIQIWVAEVDESDNNLSGGLRSSDNFTMVFNDSIDVEALSEGEFYFPFEESAFTYTGGNLIVMFYRIDDGLYNQMYWLGEDADVSNRSAGIQFYGGEIDLSDAALMNSHYSLATAATLPNTVFHKNESGIGQVEGYVFDENSNPFEGVTVTLPGTSATTTTDEFGFYEFLVAPEGDRAVKAVYFGYNDVIDTVTVLAGDVSQLDINMSLKPQMEVTGHIIKSDDGLGVAGLDVTLEGYEDYSATTDVDGYFTFSTVYANETYTISAELEHYEPFAAEVIITDTANVDLGDITLQEIFEPAFFVNTNEVETGMEITWNKPYTGVNDSIGLHDEPGFWSGYAAEVGENVWMGNLYDVTESGTINGFDIQIYNWEGYDYTAGEVTMEIFDMNEDLIASVPFTIPVIQDEEFYMIHVDVPNVTFNGSFYAMIHWNELSAITPLVAFETGYNITAPNLARYKYEGESIKMFSDIGAEGIFEMGVEVTLADGTKKVIENAKAHEGYNVYRGLTSEINEFDALTPLNSSMLTSADDVVNFIDETWPPAESGYYTYAVEAIYTESNSVMSFSQTVPYGIYSAVDINVTANNGVSTEGAMLKLHNNNGNDLYEYESLVGAGGTVSFGIVKLGTYTVTIEKFGFETYVDNAIEIDEATETIDIELIENIVNPGDLSIDIDDATHSALLSWNIGSTTEYILDDDSYENGLALNPGNDAYLGNLFNVGTTGSLIEFTLHGQQNTGISGETVTIEVFDLQGNLLGTTSEFEIPANSWMTVSTTGIEFNGGFYAMIRWNNLTGNTNFISVDENGSNSNLGYYYDAANGFLPLADLGATGVFLLRATAIAGKSGEIVTITPQSSPAELSNIYIQENNKSGNAAENLKEVKLPIAFHVYLNDMSTPVASAITEREYTFTQEQLATNGTHTAGVVAVYATGDSDQITMDFDMSGISTEDISLDNISVYPNPANNVVNIVNAEGASIEVYNMGGSKVMDIDKLMENHIDISTLDNGLYIIRIVSGNEIKNVKLEVK
jgi:hypothetical protein